LGIFETPEIYLGTRRPSDILKVNQSFCMGLDCGWGVLVHPPLFETKDTIDILFGYSEEKQVHLQVDQKFQWVPKEREGRQSPPPTRKGNRWQP
jgi:hypothetical protein